MVKNLVTLGADASIKEAVRSMSDHEIGCLIITQAHTPLGIITERDMLKRVLLEEKDPATTKVCEIMSAPLILGEPRMDVQDAVKLMLERKIKRLPISEEGQLVGLITLTDLARSIAYLEHIFSKSSNTKLE